MNKLAIIVNNYNYGSFLDKNRDAFITASRYFDVYIVDDQSTNGDYELLKNIFEKEGVSVEKTRHPKSSDNSINQIKAILRGVEIAGDEYDGFWLLDADDVPINIEAVYDFLRTTSSSVVVFSAWINSTEIVPVKKRYWISNFATSQVVINREHLSNLVLQSDCVRDVWIDARIGYFFKNKIEISLLANCDRIIHGDNDSLRYSGSRWRGRFRAIRTLCKLIFLRISHSSFR